MITVDFLIREFPDGRLMLLLGFREGKNFRAHRKGNTIYYTWCPHEDDLKTAGKIYEATNSFNSKLIKKEQERRDLKKGSDSKLFYMHTRKCG